MTFRLFGSMKKYSWKHYQHILVRGQFTIEYLELRKHYANLNRDGCFMYCMYLRKSRADAEAEARGEGETLLRHEKALLDLSKRLHIHIEKIYREIVSGETIAVRPVVQQLLSEVEQGIWDGVFVMEVERLARGDTVDQGIVAQTFKYSNTRIITPSKTYDPNNEFDEEYFEFGLFMSRREYKTINRRMQRGRLQSVKEGRYLGSKPPYGYKRVKLENEKGYTLKPDPERANVVRFIFDLYTRRDRIGVSKIVRKLNEMKAPTANGGSWVPTTVQSILHNPVYIGKIRWNSRPRIKKMVNGQVTTKRPRSKPEDWILVDGAHEAIINMDTWNTAQKYLSGNKAPRVPKKRKVKNPLAGLVVCGKCGRKMVRRPYSNGQNDTLMCAITACDNVSSALHIVEELILKALKDYLEKYKVEVKNSGYCDGLSPLETDFIQKRIENLDKDMETLEKQSGRLHDLLEQGIYSTDTFLERSRILREKKESNQNEKAALKERLRKYKQIENAKKIIIPKVENLLAVYSKLKTPGEKNRMLKEVIEKVTYIKNDNGRWNPDAEIQLELYPKLPKNQ